MRKPSAIKVPSAAVLDRLADLVLARIEARSGRQGYFPEEVLLAPFCESGQTSNAILRLLPATWRKKWAAWYAKFGCLACQTTATPHAACGFCSRCYLRTTGRLRKILAELNDGRGERRFLAAHCATGRLLNGLKRQRRRR